MYWDILAATIAAIILGFLWYGPLFGKQFIRHMKITPKQMEEAKKKGMPKSTYVWLFLSTLATAYVLKLVLLQFPFNQVSSLLITTVVLWLGFMLPLLIDNVLWESKPMGLFWINASYRLAALLLMTGVYLAF